MLSRCNLRFKQIAVIACWLALVQSSPARADLNACLLAQLDPFPENNRYAGGAPGFVGLNQLNIVLPAGIAPGVHTVIVTRNGRASDTVTIAIR